MTSASSARRAERRVQSVLNPILLYAACALGGVGVLVALPGRRASPYAVGAVLGGAALGLVFIGLGVAWPDHLPNLHFYLFATIALGCSLRVITHQRPVYAALYFVLMILATSGLYLILSAEFLAFALVIVYAGAILITYLFVIMLATESPTQESAELLSDYDRQSRDPLGATLAGFVLLAGLTVLLAQGSAGLPSAASLATTGDDQKLALVPAQVERTLARARDAQGERLLQPGERLAIADDESRDALIAAGVLAPERWPGVRPQNPEGAPAYAISPAEGWLVIAGSDGGRRVLERAQWPADLSLPNTLGVGFALIDEHPGAIEIAGVILLMAMLGAVVLARKKVEMDEAVKAMAAAHERSGGPGVDVLGMEGPYVEPGVGQGGRPA
ncbi:MAG: hypothetical protein C0513_03505 [Isosphaera sp.]|nr:hypothetical protein [Isosphaera sp.]